MMLVLMLSISVMGCQRTSSAEPTKKTPNQILWQIHDHVRQLAKDLKSAYDLKFISAEKYKELQCKIETAAKYYNQLKAHYELWKELNEDYQNKITVTLLFVTRELQKREKKDGE